MWNDCFVYEFLKPLTPDAILLPPPHVCISIPLWIASIATFFTLILE